MLNKKLFITYIVHVVAIILFWIISRYLLKLTSPYIWLLIIITVYIVEVAPIFTIHLKKKFSIFKLK